MSRQYPPGLPPSHGPSTSSGCLFTLIDLIISIFEKSGSRVPPPPPPHHHHPHPTAYPPRVATESDAAAAFVVALLSLVTCPFIGVFGLVLANKAEERIRASGGWLRGSGLVNAARVISLISIALSVVLVIVMAYLLTQSGS
jgi:hypothetical protein